MIVVHWAVEAKNGTPSYKPPGAAALEEVVGSPLGNPGTKWKTACGLRIGGLGAEVCSGENWAVSCPTCQATPGWISSPDGEGIFKKKPVG